jgi:hypothetical protein
VPGPSGFECLSSTEALRNRHPAPPPDSTVAQTQRTCSTSEACPIFCSGPMAAPRGACTRRGGLPCARLNEYDRVASPQFLERPESFARYEIARKVVSRYGYIQMFGRIAYVGRAWKEREMTFDESLDGLEAQIEGQRVAIMKDYWKSKKLPSRERRTTPPRSYFQPFDRTTCPGAGLIPFKLQRWYFACITTLLDKRHGDGHPTSDYPYAVRARFHARGGNRPLWGDYRVIV